MKIEEKKSSEASKPSEIAGNFPKSYSAHQSPILLNENAKVIKLIHQKMYPLNHSQKSALIFPKLKDKHRQELPECVQLTKKYTQISMEDEHNGLVFQPRTDLDNQQRFRGTSKNRKTTHKYRIHQPEDTLATQNGGLAQSQSSNLSQTIHIDRSLMSDDNSNETIYGESWENAHFFHTQAQRMMNETIKHSDFLRKMKQDIQKQKEIYYSNASFTEVFDNAALAQKDKQNYTIQYLLNSIEKKNMRNRSNLPYQSESPNKLGQFAKLFEKKSRNLMLWEELTEVVLQKEKSCGEELKNSIPIRKMNRNQTIIQEQSDINLDNAYAAKYRIKNNHKRMIQLAKTKGV